MTQKPHFPREKTKTVVDHFHSASFRRRFSQGAIEPIKDLLQDMGQDKNLIESPESKTANEAEECAGASSIFDVLSAGKEVSAETAENTRTSLKSLTGSNVSGWKYQVKNKWVF